MAQGIPVSDLESLAQCARAYAASCVNVVTATDAAIETANNARSVRAAADRRPQHEMSIKNLSEVAGRQEQKFVPLYETFAAACTTARDAAARFLDACTGHDPDLVLFQVTGEEGWQQAGAAAHILRAPFGPSPARFLQGIEAVNAATDADIFQYGEEGFIGHVYSPPLPTERVCPWCAETIKAAAIICRFCQRDVRQPPNLPGA